MLLCWHIPRDVFSEDFRHVSGGEVRAFDAAGEPKATHRYGHHLHYKLYVEEMAQLFEPPPRLGEFPPRRAP